MKKQFIAPALRPEATLGRLTLVQTVSNPQTDFD